MKIGIDARPLQMSKRAGISVYTAEIIRHMQADMTLFTTAPLPSDFLPLDSRHVNCVTWPLPFQRFGFGKLWESLLLPPLVNSSKVDVFWGPRFFVPRGLKTPSVVTIHDLAFIKYPEVVNKRQYDTFDSLIRKSIPRATRFVAVSNTTREDFCEHYGVNPARVSVVHNGLSERYRLGVGTEVLNSIKVKFELPDQFILFTGTIEPRKNLGRLLSAYCLSNAASEGIPLVIAGKTGWLQSTLFKDREKLLEERKVILLGYVSDNDLAALYQACLFFAFPSLYEGFGIPVLEAMASGAPVLTSNTSALREIYEGAALTVDPLSSESISDGINRMLVETTRAEFIRKGTALAANFSWKRSAAEHMLLFERILA